MRIVTVSFVTVTELIVPCPTKSSKYRIKPLLISITPFFQRVPTATGRPVHCRFSAAVLLYSFRVLPSSEIRAVERADHFPFPRAAPGRGAGALRLVADRRGGSAW